MKFRDFPSARSDWRSIAGGSGSRTRKVRLGIVGVVGALFALSGVASGVQYNSIAEGSVEASVSGAIGRAAAPDSRGESPKIDAGRVDVSVEPPLSLIKSLDGAVTKGSPKVAEVELRDRVTGAARECKVEVEDVRSLLFPTPEIRRFGIGLNTPTVEPVPSEDCFVAAQSLVRAAAQASSGD